MLISFCDSVPGDSLVFHQKIEAPYVFDLQYVLSVHAKQGNEPHVPARCMSHTSSRVAAGTWGIFASYSGDGHSKLHFVQRSQDSCVVVRDTSGI